MNKTMKRLAMLLAIPVSVLAATYVTRAASNLPVVETAVEQGSELTARVNTVEQRITALKEAIANNPQMRQHRGTLSTLENRKNAIKFKLRSDDNASRSQLEQDLKDLENRVTELENAIK